MKEIHKSNTLVHCFRLMKRAKKMHVELNEYRYFLEKNVTRRTEYLSRRIELLEACNASLCQKLALAKQESGVAGRQEVPEATRRLYLLENS